MKEDKRQSIAGLQVEDQRGRNEMLQKLLIALDKGLDFSWLSQKQPGPIRTFDGNQYPTLQSYLTQRPRSFPAHVVIDPKLVERLEYMHGSGRP